MLLEAHKAQRERIVEACEAGSIKIEERGECYLLRGTAPGRLDSGTVAPIEAVAT